MTLKHLFPYLFPYLFSILILSACKEAKPPQLKENKVVDLQEDNFYVPFEKEKQQALKRYFDHLHKVGYLNGNVLISQNNKIIFQKSYGYASFRPKKKLTEHSVFKIGSVSKQFTAVAILQLYEKGLLSLQDSVQKFYPDFPYKDINIHELLCHRSGLMNYIYFCEEYPLARQQPIDNQWVIRAITDSFPRPYYSPNRRYDYSNTGYMLLAGIVEKVSHLPFPEYMQKNIFEPLKMTSSYIFDFNHPKEDSNLVTSYENRWRKNPPNYLDGMYGDKGVCTTTKDLFLWEQNLYNGTIIKKESLDLAFQIHGKPKRFKRNYGYGWRVYDYKTGEKIAYHAGWWHGYQSLLIHSEKNRSSIIILKNKMSRRINDQKKILDILYRTY